MPINKRTAKFSIAAVSIFLAGVGFWSIQSAQKVWLAKIASAGGCSCMSGSSLTWSGWFTFGIAGLFALGLIAAVAYATATLMRTRKIMQALKKCALTELGGVQFYRVSEKRCGAFTFGFLRPKIVLCEHCIKTLSAPEIGAILRHEQYHVQRRDPLRFFILETLKRMYFFAPILYPLISAYRTAAEVQADETVADRDSLGRALLHVTADQQSWGGGAAFACAIDERIKRLINPQWKMTIYLPVRLVALSGAIFAAAVFLFSQAPAAAPDVRHCALHSAPACVRSAPSYGADLVSFTF